MKIVKFGDTYINFENVTHAEVETTPHGLMCIIYFACQTTDENGSNGVQASKAFTGTAANELKAFLELRTKVMEG